MIFIFKINFKKYCYLYLYNKLEIIKILNLFNKKVKNKKIDLSNIKNHCGKEGYWLEKQMGITHNSQFRGSNFWKKLIIEEY